MSTGKLLAPYQRVLQVKAFWRFANRTFAGVTDVEPVSITWVNETG
jgi:hypothetical protein